MRVQINATNFPDEAFRNYVETYLDLAADGYIDDDDITDTTSIRIPYSGNSVPSSEAIHNLKGIEYFTEVTSLIIFNEPIESGLVFGNLKKMKSCDIQLDDVAATSLDFRGCDSLATININDNYGTKNYTNIYLNDTLKSFTFKCYGTAALDFSNCSALETVSIEGYVSPISGLNDHTNIETVSVKSRSVVNLDLSNNQSLASLDCSMAEHTLPQLTSLNCSNCPALKVVNCSGCESLSSLDFTGCSDLETLRCNDIAVRPALDLHEFKKLKALSVVNTNLSSLLLGEKPVLRELYCYTDSSNIYIRTLDLNGCDILRDAFVLNGTFSTHQVASVLRLQCDSRTVRAPVKITAFNGDDFVLRADQHSIYTDAYTSFAWSAWNRTTNEKVGSGANHNSDYFWRSVATYSSKATSEKNGNLYYFEFRYPSSGTDSTTYISPDYLLSVVEPPVITSQPESTIAAAGSTVSLSVAAEYETPSDLTYQWERLGSNGDWINAPGESTSVSYQFVCNKDDDGSQYRCAVSAIGKTLYSESAQLRVVTEPVISVHPMSRVIATGSTVTFSVSLER